MNAWRTSIMARRRLALLLVAVVLFAKVFVPTGYMFAPTAGGFTVQMCSGQGAMPVMLDIGKPAPAEDHSGKMDAPCAFSGIGMAATAAVDVALLIVAIAFIVALGTQSTHVSAVLIFMRLRPPLRAPPIFG
jgi:hypothetical protein